MKKYVFIFSSIILFLFNLNILAAAHATLTIQNCLGATVKLSAKESGHLEYGSLLNGKTVAGGKSISQRVSMDTNYFHGRSGDVSIAVFTGENYKNQIGTGTYHCSVSSGLEGGDMNCTVNPEWPDSSGQVSGTVANNYVDATFMIGNCG